MSGSKVFGYVYLIKTSLSDKVYIGQTSRRSIEKRFREHILTATVDSYPKYALHHAMIKYGVDSFSIQELEKCHSQEQLNDREMFYISYYDSIIDKNGYNLTYGGAIGKPSEETRKKQSAVAKGRMPSPQNLEILKIARKQKRPPLSEAHKESVSSSKIGKKQSPESIAKRVASRAGYRHSEETKMKMSITQKGIPRKRIRIRPACKCGCGQPTDEYVNPKGLFNTYLRYKKGHMDRAKMSRDRSSRRLRDDNGRYLPKANI